MRRYLPAILGAAILFTACADKNHIRISGKADRITEAQLVLSRIDIDRPVPVDSTGISRKGSFSFRVNTEEPAFYQLSLSDSNFVTILAEPGEKISLRFPSEFLYDRYEVKGSPGTMKIKMLDSALAVTKQKADSLRRVYLGLVNSPDLRQREQELNDEYVRILKDQRMFNIGFILENLRSFASIKALYQKIDEATYVLYDSRDLQFLKLVSDTLSKYYPSSRQVKALKQNLEKELKQTMLNKINEITKDIEPTKLDPSLVDINGKRITLSSLKGRYVLLAFWSAASRDCLNENLQLKELYARYRNRGFEIYQINLDTNEETWRRAVKFDELPWISVREDDPLNPKNAIVYNVRILPANYLYDKQGNIIGSNLHGRTLQLRLEQIFGN